jgi:hypothetical protein
MRQDESERNLLEQKKKAEKEKAEQEMFDELSKIDKGMKNTSYN